jgi:hypothetical protein
MFRQCGIFSFSIRFWNCSDSVVFFVFLLDFGNVLTVWYFLFFYWILELFWQCGIFCFSIGFWNCSDSVVFLFINLLSYFLEIETWKFKYIYIIFENKIRLNVVSFHCMLVYISFLLCNFWYLKFVHLPLPGIISPRGYNPPSSKCFGTDMIYQIYLLAKFIVPK